MNFLRQPQAIAGHALPQSLDRRRARRSPAAGAAPARPAARASGRGPAAVARSTCPARRRTARRRRTGNARLVATPAASSAMPSASTSGATVGSGISTDVRIVALSSRFGRSCAATPARPRRPPGTPRSRPRRQSANTRRPARRPCDAARSLRGASARPSTISIAITPTVTCRP